MPERQVIVIGAGIVGLGVAVELVWRGSSVTLIDPREPGSAASSGNTGWVVPALSAPIPAPGLPLQVARWMLQSDSPFRVELTKLTGQLDWLRRFRSYCNATSHRNGLTALGRLNAESYSGFRRWIAAGLSFEWDEPGVTFVAEGPDDIEHIVDEMELLSDWGYQPAESLDPYELRSRYPEISAVAAYGVHARREQYVRPEQVVNALVETLAPATEFVRGELNSVDDWSPDRIVVSAGDRQIEGDAVVIATGAWSAETAAAFDLELPIIAGKGYSITVDEPDLKLSGPLYLSDARIACTPFAGANRFAGLMELTGPDDSVDPRRLATMTNALDRYLPGWNAGREQTTWAGLRPMSPDGLPIIGNIPERENVYVASGHGMLGVTMAPVTGEIIADLIVNGTTRHDLTAFRPDRF